MKINLGDKVADTVTTFKGVVVARTDFLNGCTRIGVQSEKLKDGAPAEACWFDEPQLRLIEAGKVLRGPTNTGGPMSHTPRRAKDAG